ncbi:MAG TPA: HIT domain-containing protein [Trueperaceae bacterium]
MSQFRKDPFGSGWVIISPERGLEPSDFGSAGPESGSCPLCPGFEGQSGAEVRALRPSNSGPGEPDWRIRVLRPSRGILDTTLGEGPFAPQGDELYTHAPSSGYQEIVVDHPDHAMRLGCMPREHLIDLLKLYRDRLTYLAGRPGIRHVQIMRNVGRAAGAVSGHPHAQILALPVTNRWVEEERAAAEAYLQQSGRCLFCEVIEAELSGRARLVSSNDAFVALAPYAAKTPFETWILPRRHGSSFCDLPSNNLGALAEVLQSVLGAMNAALDQPPYNMILHTLPQTGAAGYHWHFKLLPRLTQQAGFDWGSGFYVNPTPPEDAVRFLREALALQDVH